MNRSEANRLQILETEKSIRNAFFDLISKRKFGEISVTDVCKEAHISRGTFYLHYKDVEDLGSIVQKEFADKILSIYQEASPFDSNKKTRQFMEKLTDYVESNKNIFDLMENYSVYGSFDRVRNMMIGEDFKENENVYNRSSTYNRLSAAFVVSGLMGVIHGWVLDHYRLPKEELIECAVDMLERLR